MTSLFLNRHLPHALVRGVVVLEQHPWRVLIAALLFAMVWRGWGVSAALFWGVALLMMLLHMSMRSLLLIALLLLPAIPFLYLLDRPAQAERAGVLVFVLLILASLVNVADVWRSSTSPTVRGKSI